MSCIIGIIGRPNKRSDNVLVDTTTNMIRRAIIKNGGTPILILPPQDINYYDTESSNIASLTDIERKMLIDSIKLCDGLVFQGGNRWYEYDEFILNYAIDNDIPSLLICMSMQLLCACALHKDNLPYNIYALDNHNGNDICHNVNISRNGVLYKILGKDKLNVNSMHRYAVKSTNLFVEAISDDNVIEAISYPSKKFILGVQWHPEKLIDEEIDANKIFKYFIDIAK